MGGLYLGRGELAIGETTARFRPARGWLRACRRPHLAERPVLSYVMDFAARTQRL